MYQLNDYHDQFQKSLFEIHCKTKGIKHRLSEQNGQVERKHGNIVSTARCFFFQLEVPKKYWSETCSAAVYTINRTPSKILNFSSPFSILYNKDPDINYFKVFDYLCFPLIPNEDE